VLAVAVLVYWPGLTGPLLLDDGPQLNSLIEQGAEAPSFLLHNYVLSTSGPLGRPVSMLSFIGDSITHGPDIWWWKFNSLMLHLLCGLVLAWFMAHLVRAGGPGSVDPWMAGIAIAGLWLLHPLNVSTVLYVVQRMTILSTLFVFTGLLCYVKGRLLLAERPVTGWTAMAAAFAVCLPLAALSKESGALLPVYITLVEFLVFRFRGTDRVRRALRLGHGALLAGYGAVAVLLIANSGFVLDAYAAREFTLLERLLTESRVLVAYLVQIVLPLPGQMGFFHDDVALSRGLLSPPSTLLALLFLAGLAGAAWRVRKRYALVTFGIFFFLASHGMESTVFGLELMFEHRNYTGSPGIILAVLAGLAATVSRRDIVAATAALCLLATAALTHYRASIWSQPVTMYQYMYTLHPDSSRLNLIFANVYARAGQWDVARATLENVTPGAGRALNMAYLDCLERGQVPRESLARLRQEAGGVLDSHVVAMVDLLVDGAAQKHCQVPLADLAEALDGLLDLQDRSYRDRQAVLVAKARLLDAMGETDAAVATLADAQSLSGVHAMPLYRAADMLARRGRADEARDWLRRAADVESDSRIVRTDIAERVYAGIADWYVNAGDAGEAVAVYGEALDVTPGNLRFRVSKAELEFGLGRYDDAARTLAGAESLDAPEWPEFERRIGRLREALDAAHPARVEES